MTQVWHKYDTNLRRSLFGDRLFRTIPRPAPTLPKPHYPSKIANTLASLVKGRWIEGKAQTVALLLSACDMPTLFILQTFLPSRLRDCSPSAPSIRFSALSHSLFVLQSSVCLYGFAFALSHSLFILQSSVCLYGFAFALSHSLFVLQSSVCLYGFAFALSHSLFVGERACPSRWIEVIDFLSVFNLLSIVGKTQFLFTL